MPFYTYSQNNSGGSFQGHQYIIIEADNYDKANLLALAKTTIYFNGVQEDRDCRCCGDRWTENWSEGDKVPSIYGIPIEECNSAFDSEFALIYYADSSVKEVIQQKNKPNIITDVRRKIKI